MKRPFINVVIPTREHAATLPWTIKTCLAQDYNNYQIIIADNVSQDETAEVIAQFNDSRIKYVKSPKRLSMAHNWELALEHVENGYAIILGDDDGLVPYSLTKVAEVIEETGTLAIRTQNIVYLWPNAVDKNVNGMLFHVPFSDSYRWIDSKQLLQKVADNLEYLPPNFLDLPSIYHCFISNDIIKHIKQRDGVYLNSCSPDMYSAVITAAELDKYIKLETPVIINAMSAQSNGLSNNMSHNNSEIKRFMSEGIIPFHKTLVPQNEQIEKMLSRPILVADQYLNAKEKNKNIPNIDIKKLIKKSAESAGNWVKPEQYSSVLNETKMVGEVNGMMDYAEKIISRSIHNAKNPSRSPVYTFNKEEKTLHIDTLILDVENVYDVSNLIYKITQTETIRNAIMENKKSPESIINQIKYDFHPFLNPELSADNIDRYFIRSSILNAINSAASDFKGVLLDLGCGEMPYRDYIVANSNITKYIGIDIENPIYQKNSKPDKFWDGKSIPLEDNSIDTVMATELFEHLPDVQSVLKEINRVLKSGGMLFFTVPFLWPLHDVPYDEYRYTPFALERHLKSADMNSIKIKPYGGWNASLAQMIGLWLKRSGLQESDRKRLTEQLFPFYKELLETDLIPKKYDNGPMVPGFSGTAKKKMLIEQKESSTIVKELVVSENRFKLKVIVIVYFFPKLSETFILDQITGLIDQGVDVEIWAQHIPEEQIIHSSVLKYELLSRVKYIQFPNSQLTDNEWQKEFTRINKVNLSNNDIFHVHFGQNFISFKKLLKSINNPVMVSFHGLDASQYILENGSNCYDELFERANLISTPSYEMQNVLVSIGSNKNKMVIHRYGVDTSKFCPHNDLTKNKPITLLTVARLVEKKGIKFSLKAFAKVRPDNAIYNIIGEGQLDKDLRKLVEELALTDKVNFLGPKSKEEIIEQMKNSDIYVLTSITASNGDKEGLPVTLIEAQSVGLPAVSTYHAGIPELVTDYKTGFLCNEKDVDKIAESLDKLIHNEELRKQFSENARIKVFEEFNIKTLNEELMNYYKNLIKEFGK